jgi:hypothetical protein
MKFLPPEEEIRAQLRELTSQTRRLRADIQGMITRRGPSDTASSHDHRHRIRPERAVAVPPEKPDEAPARKAESPDKKEHKAHPARKRG